MKTQLDAWIASEKTDFIAKFKRLVESPSVSAQSQHKADIRETAKIAAEYLTAIGAEVRIVETSGNPVVHGYLHVKDGAPTVAIYNHLDVQPAAKGKDGWTRDPFVFTEENGRYYSRGTTDDKGPALTAWWAAHCAKRLGIPTNIEFIWELEEEIGSPHFHEFIEGQKSRIRAQSIIVSDSIWVARGKPATSIGLRGLLATLVRLRTGAKDVHSGLCGGAARNPITELCEVVAKCVNARTGEILIPGFQDTWKLPPESEISDYVNSGFSVDYFKEAHKLQLLRSEDVREVTTRIWARPTCEVHGIAGGYQDEGVKTIIPPFAEAKISFRLVPGQDPKQVFKLFSEHVKRICPEAEVIQDGVLEPYLSSSDPAAIAKVKEAFAYGFNAPTAAVREGGSIGAVVTMNKILKVPVMFMGLSLPEDGYHGPDESFAWEQIEGGMKSFVKYFELCSKG